jgi:hypothetical protein
MLFLMANNGSGVGTRAQFYRNDELSKELLAFDDAIDRIESLLFSLTRTKERNSKCIRMRLNRCV